jgi:hypothetical protein
MRTLTTIVLALTALAVFSISAEAGGRRRLFQGRAAASFRQAHPPLDAREVYPKYYGGFHARQLQNIGIPTGDIGIRGNGITATPW